MPIFFDDFKRDEQAITELAVGVADYWNAYGTERYAFKVFTSEEAIQAISRSGDHLLGGFFPEQPGAFKRIATLLVLSRLQPLFSLATADSTPKNLKRVQFAIDLEWLPRICFMLIEPAFDMLQVEKGESAHKLDDWAGFPSAHSKAEFIQWLDWLRDFPADKLPPDENGIRRVRMIMAAALILEAVYFQKEPRREVCGACDDKVDLTCVTFEGYLWEAYQRNPERLQTS